MSAVTVERNVDGNLAGSKFILVNVISMDNTITWDLNIIPEVPTSRQQCGRLTIPACSCPYLVCGHSASRDNVPENPVKPGPPIHASQHQELDESVRGTYASPSFSCVHRGPECLLVQTPG